MTSAPRKRYAQWCAVACAVVLSLIGVAVAAQAATSVRVSSSGVAAAATSTPIGQLAAGGDSTCSVSGGTVRCWGDNSLQKLGDDGSYDSSIPVVIPGLSGVTAVATGGRHACALIVGAVKCWGSNTYGELGNGSTVDSQAPVTVTGLTGVTALALGAQHSCALLSAGTVKCWGDNTDGQLGNASAVAYSSTPVPVSGLTGTTALSSGPWQTCAVVAAGAVKCWYGAGQAAAKSVPVIVPGVVGAIAVAPGAEHSCALLATGGVSCWGDDTYGELGNGTTSSTSMNAVTVSGISGAVAVTVGQWVSCALLSTGTVRCWGTGYEGELGTGTTYAVSLSPAAVPGVSGATALAGGDEHVCALVTSTATTYCWGDNEIGQIGDAAVRESDTPRVIPTVTGAKAVVAGPSHDCALGAAGSLTCWGAVDKSNATGPLAFPGVTNAVSVAASPAPLVSGTDFQIDEHSCAALVSGSVVCWGSNSEGQLGSATAGSGPVTVSGVTGATAVAVGNYHSCAIVTAGAVKCWGYNGVGELGNGTTTSSISPVTVTGITGATALAAGGSHTCALLGGGTVKCWGENTSGELGNGSTVAWSTTPVTVPGLTGVKSISAGANTDVDSIISSHFTSDTCAALSSGVVQCWGADYSVTKGAVNHLVTIATVTGAVAVGVAGDHACALISGGSVKCWTDPATAATVAGISGATSLSAGSGQTCAVISAGAVTCWGDNEYGQLDLPSFTPTVSPVAVAYPNLTVTSVASSAPSPATAQAVTFAATVKNTGIAPTPAGAEIGVNFQIDGKTVTWSDTDTTSLAPGATVTLTANGGPAGKATWAATVGTHTLTAYADEANFIAESSETDNTLNSSITVINRPNLTVTAVNSNPITPAVGQAATFSATVKNTGLAATPAGAEIGVNFQIDGKTVTWSDTDTTSLAPGATVTLTANGGPAGKATWVATSGAHTLTAYADEANFIAESNETDNTLSATLAVR